ncbi:MAG: preprotein translocase subunit SecG [Deltaproteobacteria bacterium]
MEILITLVKVIHIVVSLLLIITVLLQPGKGGDLGSVFGGGASESIFGASGAVPFLTKFTRILAALFITTSLSLGYFSAQSVTASVVEDALIPPITSPLESPASALETPAAPAQESQVLSPDEVSDAAPAAEVGEVSPSPEAESSGGAAQ